MDLDGFLSSSYDVDDWAGPSDRFVGPPPLSWDDELTPEDHDELRQLIGKLQPKYKPPSERYVDAEVTVAARKRLTVRHFSDSQLRPRDHELVTSQHMNARLMLGGSRQPWEREGARGPVQVPKVMIVSGHSGQGGNIGLNGIYERYPDDYCGRPVYQKFLERGPGLSPSDTRMNRAARAGSRDFGSNTPTARTLLDRREKVAPLSWLPPVSSGLELQPARSAWFLYFHGGFWQIGPRVGSREAFARTPGAEDIVPSSLLNWEVWDMGLKRYARSKGLRALKGGL